MELLDVLVEADSDQRSKLDAVMAAQIARDMARARVADALERLKEAEETG